MSTLSRHGSQCGRIDSNIGISIRGLPEQENRYTDSAYIYPNLKYEGESVHTKPVRCFVVRFKWFHLALSSADSMKLRCFFHFFISFIFFDSRLTPLFSL